ncbi:acyltransferase [Mesorhizobium sp. M0933]|uniref:acyltransferase n=1 Tax=Mesorhizobium sp. M0933 TaxID=2957030 RepID=UPI00333557B7
MVRFSEAIKRYGLLELAFVAASRCLSGIYTRLYARVFGIDIGYKSVIHLGAKLRRDGGSIRIGEYCVIHSGARILAYGGEIQLGNHVSVNPFCILYGHGGLRVGNGVLIGASTIIIPANHKIDRDRPIRNQGLSSQGIEIQDDVWIGTGARLLDGVVIERGAVLAAGSVVPKGMIPSFSIVGGVPARKIGERS